ncbi:MAG: NAD(P)-binding domain-containing protein [Pseudomonadota bacterium]
MSRVGFIGTGHIAAPMARLLAREGHEVVVSERNAEVAADLAASRLGIKVASNQGVVETSEVVFLCLRPAVWADVVTPLTFHADQKIVSVMAGVPLAELADACAPASEISATLPYGFLEHGGCPLPVAGDPTVMQDLFGATNIVIPQANEEALSYHFSASSLASGVLGLMETSTDWLADKLDDADKAEVFVSNVVFGILRELDKTKAGVLRDERQALASPNTLNLQMYEGLAETFKSMPEIHEKILKSMEAS